VATGLLSALAGVMFWAARLPPPPQRSDHCTANNARLALVELLCRDDAFEGWIGQADLRRQFDRDGISRLESSGLYHLTPSYIQVDDFDCDLAARTFSWFAGSYHFFGRFEFRDGRWVAVITGSSHLNVGH
jgi:hypothetical protein